jgi:autotransporter-associated beta strand protein
MTTTQSALATAVVATCAAVFPTVTLGQARTWNGNGADNNWSTAANWSTNNIPALSNPTQIWQFGSTANRLATEMNNSYELGRVNFAGTSGHSINSASQPQQVLTLVGTGNLEIFNVAANIVGAVNVPVVLNAGSDSRIITVAGANGRLTLDRNVSAGSNQITKAGIGTLVLNGTANSFAGITLPEGAIGISNAGALGSITITSNGLESGGAAGGKTATLYSTGAAVVTTANLSIGNGIDGNGVFRLGLPGGAPGGNLTVNNISMILDGNPSATATSPADGARIDVPLNMTATVSGTITGAGLLQKIGTGTLTLNQANTGLTGGFDHFAGVVIARNDASLGSASSTYYAREGTATLAAGNAPRVIANPIELGGTVAGVNNAWGIGTADVANPITFTGTVLLTRLDDSAGANTRSKPISVAEGVTATFNNSISDGGNNFGIIKLGAGTMVINGNGSYTGTTGVSEGRLTVNGSIAASNVLVAGGVLAGTGTVRVLSVYDINTGDSVAGGMLSPGDDSTAGTLTARRADFGDGGAYLVNLNNVNNGAGVGWDLLDLVEPTVGRLNVLAASAAPFKIIVNGLGSGFDAYQDHSFTIVSGVQTVQNFDPSRFTIDATGFNPDLQGGSFSVALSADQTDLNLVYTAVPEPASLALLGLTSLGLMSRRRR